MDAGHHGDSDFPSRSLPLAAEDPGVTGQYRILRRLGQGAMGMVYLGQGDDGRYVAIKVVRPDLARDRSFLRRFHAEAQYARRVDATYTARVIAAITDVERPYLVTEFIDGPTLDDQVAEHGRLPAWDAKALAIGTAAALIAIHDAGLVHRDLKPANVMLSNFGPRVIDFGIARSVSAATATKLTAAGFPVGTPAYMSPEQIRDEEVTSASDIFSWAGVMVYASTGHNPFGTNDAPGCTVMFQILDERPLISDVPAELRELLASALSKDPAARPTARDLLARLTGSSVGDPDVVASRAITATVAAQAETAVATPAGSAVAAQAATALAGPAEIAAAESPAASADQSQEPVARSDEERIVQLLEDGRSQSDPAEYAATRSELTRLPVVAAAAVLANVSPSRAATVVQDIVHDDRSWVIDVLTAMPDEKARQILSSMNFKQRYEMSLPQSLMRLLQEGTGRSRSRTSRRTSAGEAPAAVSETDPESLAARVDRMSPDQAAATIRGMNPELSDRVLDLVGTRKARSIRRYL
jgi:predicted Ser/Thr protein kinase/flagellar motility protein MotE (MotC chaperone)